MTAMAGLYAGNVRAVLERGFKVIGNQNWTILVSGFFEPVFYLLAMGYGLGGLVGQVSGPNGTPMSYLSFIAPALLATSAMNGAIYDSTWNVFFKMKFARIYEAMLSTSLGPLDVAAGEIGMALFRGLLYACGFLVVMAGLGIATSWWALAMVPVALLIALGFAAVGMAVTSWFSTFQQMELINIVLLPMFMFSSHAVSDRRIPAGRPVVHSGIAVVAQGRVDAAAFDRGVRPMTAVHLAYFGAMSVAGVIFCALRLRALFLR
ncbi:MAG: ABC transporter permease [Micropruina glycogenica]